VQDS
jgi:hypothetical protein